MKDIIESRKIQPVEMNQQRDRWTYEEDKLLCETVKKYGTSWFQVAQSFPNRNPNSCIQRWKRLKGRNKKTIQKWTQKEDNLLQTLVATLGKKWNQISKKFIGKTNKQCMERYSCYQQSFWINKVVYLIKFILIILIISKSENLNLLSEIKGILTKYFLYNNCVNPSVNKEPFTAEEDQMIYSNYVTLGSKWSMIAMKLNGRTQNQVKNRFYSCILSSHLYLKNPYYTKLTPQQVKETLLKARLEHNEKLLLENENLNNKDFDQSQLNYFDSESQSFQVEDEDVYSNFHTLQ